jgi:hypothetical protein
MAIWCHLILQNMNDKRLALILDRFGRHCPEEHWAPLSSGKGWNLWGSTNSLLTDLSWPHLYGFV